MKVLEYTTVHCNTASGIQCWNCRQQRIGDMSAQHCKAVVHTYLNWALT